MENYLGNEKQRKKNWWHVKCRTRFFYLHFSFKFYSGWIFLGKKFTRKNIVYFLVASSLLPYFFYLFTSSIEQIFSAPIFIFSSCLCLLLVKFDLFTEKILLHVWVKKCKKKLKVEWNEAVAWESGKFVFFSVWYFLLNMLNFCHHKLLARKIW